MKDDALKILVASDKFKGSLNGIQVAQAIKDGWHRVRPSDELRLIPITDGGDGFAKIIGEFLGATIHTIPSVDAAHRPINVDYYFSREKNLAIIEAASVNGLAMMRSSTKYHPYVLDNYGLGIVLRKLSEKGISRVIIGLGGSATNDGGFGMARALGFRFLDGSGREIESWERLIELDSIEKSPAPLEYSELIAAVDVGNVLLGENGCSKVFGPQKGLKNATEIQHADECMSRLAARVKEQLGVDYSCYPGSCAAGGLGYGLMSFANAKLVSGFEIFSEVADIRRHIEWADLVITGEGCLDETSYSGKCVGELAKLCRESKIPCNAICGRYESSEKAKELFSSVCAISPELTSSQESIRNAPRWISHAATVYAEEWARRAIT